MNNNDGYTLSELLITLSISALLTSAVIPAYAHLQREVISTSDKSKLIEAISLARTTAISQGRVITSCLSDNGQQCSRYGHKFIMVFIDGDDNKMASTSELIYRMAFSDTEASITLSVSGGRHYIRHKPDGTVKEFGNIQYCPAHLQAEYATQLIINYGGRLRLAADSNHNGIPENKQGVDIRC